MTSEIVRVVTLNFPSSFRRKIDDWLGGLGTSYGSIFGFLLAFSDHIPSSEKEKYNQLADQMLQRKLMQGVDRFSFRAQLTLECKNHYHNRTNLEMRRDILSSMLAIGIIRSDD